MKLNLTKMPLLLQKIQRYRVLLFAVLFLGIYIAVTYRINQLTMQEPTPQAVSERIKTVQRIKIDKESIEKLEQLESQNIEVKSLFNEARTNPFSE